jgi:predicted glycosyltransferase
MYVLEDREVIDINKQFLGNDPELEKKIKYLGKITNRTYPELPSRSAVLNRLGLPDEKLVVVSLGRNQKVCAISGRLVQAFENIRNAFNFQPVMVLDPYMDHACAMDIKRQSSGSQIKCLDFAPDLVELIRHSELVISRAGYNTVNEILLTGAKAILIPESHGSGEQELRVRNIGDERLRTVTEEQILGSGTEELILDMLNQNGQGKSLHFDKYAIGKQILEDLEDWKSKSSCRQNFPPDCSNQR